MDFERFPKGIMVDPALKTKLYTWIGIHVGSVRLVCQAAQCNRAGLGAV